ncbi:hypothetical protein Leryth_025331 [Lithospermum erythrorhizon]|nr:hypothetical protein Leryth_025331 [Lithospermum erythrorhizon]
MYATLFTKFRWSTKRLGYLGRFYLSLQLLATLVLFIKESKDDIKGVDIAITYTLICGAIALDIIAALMLVFSDWFKVQTQTLLEVLEEDQIRTATAPDPDNLFTDSLRDHIFEELRVKAEMADDLETAKELSSARGDWVLRVEGKTNFLHYILEVDYDQSLLLWHIATELCFNDEINQETQEKSKTETNTNTEQQTENSYRSFAKLLSEYMIYLLVMQPTIMSAVTGIGQVRFRDTCAEARKFFSKERQVEEPNLLSGHPLFFQFACSNTQ